MEGSLKPNAANQANHEILIYLLFVSTFLHFVVTCVVLLAVLIAILLNKSARAKLFTHPGSKFLPVFSIAVALMAAFRENWLGVACAVGFFLILLLSLWARTNLTRYVFERALSYCSIISCSLTPCAFIQARFLPLPDERVTLWFFNSNYMAFMCLIAFAISVYKLLDGKGHLWIYATAVLCNLISMYFCGSIFIWIDVLVVTVLLLLLSKKWWPLLGLVVIAGIIGVIIYNNPTLVPRYYAADDATEFRFSIWSAAIEAIKKSPFFGYGFLAFNHINCDYPEAFAAPHTHNILLEIFLDFGIVGVMLMLPFFINYFRVIVKCYEYSVTRSTTNLIVALIVVMAVHGFTDIVFLWIQTGTLMALILGGLGMDERQLYKAQTGAKPPTNELTQEPPAS